MVLSYGAYMTGMFLWGLFFAAGLVQAISSRARPGGSDSWAALPELCEIQDGKMEGEMRTSNLFLAGPPPWPTSDCHIVGKEV